jgi:general secretion pathway protein H
MNRNDAGFTLLEMVCVMAIVALLAAFAMPSPHTRTSRAGVERLAREAASIMKSDRYAAVRRRAAVATTVDLRAREIVAGSNGVRLHVPPDVTINATVASYCTTSGTRVGLSFTADGRSCGGTVRFSRELAVYEVRVNWLTGGIEVVAPSAS